MKTRTIELTEATEPLAEYARQIEGGPIVITLNGRPIAAIVAVPNADIETISLSPDPEFLALIEHSRTRQQREGGISSGDMRQRLGLPAQHK